MTSVLNITTLGGLAIRLDEETIPPLASRKADALLVYLAQTARPHLREALAEMFWDDQPLSRSLSNLSVLLSSFRKTLPGFIQADRNSVWLDLESNCQLDARFLDAQLNEARQRKLAAQGLDQETAEIMERAIASFNGNFLDGFQLRDGRGFEEWVAMERERIHHLVFEGLTDLVTFYLNKGDYGYGLQFANRLLGLDPLREETHRQMMLLLARNDQRQQALEQFDTCKQVLARELGVEPSAETLNLYHRIQEAGHAKISLPPQTTAFIGRKNELALIGSRLANPACRLLTLAGPGGVGKTRLAVETARLNEQAFLNGIVFVPMETIDSVNLLISTIANALGFTFFGRSEPLQQLIHFLEEKEMLLILDNFEHLLSSAHLLDEILKSAPYVKILVTSRERLNIRAEWLLEVGGLKVSTPAKMDETHPTHSAEALTFFEQQAQRVQANFALNEENTQAVAQICQLVDGFPLGIELAASWVRVLSPAEIAEEIARSIDFLESSLRDVPARHRSMRAVFDRSWDQLTAREQEAFRRLSIFRGEFRREGAWEIAGASLHVLASLADKSLIQSQNGIYRTHEMTRQYAASQLSKDPAEVQSTEVAYSNYFARFLDERKDALLGGKQQRETVVAFNGEISNVRTAWNIALTHRNTTLVEQLLDPYTHFLEMRSWFQEGVEATRQAIRLLETSSNASLLARLLNWYGRFHNLLGQHAEAETLYERSRELSENRRGVQLADSYAGLAWVASYLREPMKSIPLVEKAIQLFEEFNLPRGKAEASMHLADYAREQGDFRAALVHAEDALNIYRDLQDEWSQAKCLSSVGSVYGALGEYPKARECFEQGLEICQAIDDKYGVARNAHNLSNIMYFNNDFQTALNLRKMALEHCREIGFEWGVASSLQHVGAVESQLGNFAEAMSYYRESLMRFQNVGEKRSVAYVLNMMGNLAVKQNEHEKAARYFRQGLSIGLEIEASPLILAILLGMGDIVQHREGASEFLYALITYVHDHPGTEQQTRDALPERQQEISSALTSEERARAEFKAQEWLAENRFSMVAERVVARL